MWQMSTTEVSEADERGRLSRVNQEHPLALYGRFWRLMYSASMGMAAVLAGREYREL